MNRAWETVNLGDICRITSSKRIFAKEYRTSGVPFYRGKEIIEKHNGRKVSNELYISKERYEEIRNKFDVPKKGDILLSSVGTLGVAWLVDEDEFYFKDGNLTWLRCNEKMIPGFLYLWLNSPSARNQINAMCIGSTQKALTIETLKNFLVELPPIETQKRICRIIDPISNKIKTNNQINKNLEDQAQAYFINLFIVNADPNWQNGTISDIGTVVGGGTPSKKHPEYYSQRGIPWITPKDLSIDRSKFISRGNNDISELGFSNSSATKIPKGTVLFSSRAPIGYIAIASTTVTTNQGFKSVIPNNNIGTAFIYFFLKQALPTIEGMASGSTFKEISGSGMKSVPVVIPDDETLHKFSEFCKALFEQQIILEAENRRLSSLRDTLLPKLMSGEIDVSNIDF